MPEHNDWREDFDLCFPEGERREYDSYPYPLRATEREELKAFIADEITAAEKRRDEFWEAQEMGKSSDCAQHEQEGVKRKVAEIREEVEKLRVPNTKAHEYNHAIDCVLSLLQADNNTEV